MYVLLFIIGIILCLVAIVGIIGGGIVLIDDADWFGALLVALAVACAVGGVFMIRQGSWVYSGVECAGIAEQNPELDARRVQITFWDFGCYVDTEDGVTIPWGRYRAVVEG
jgi:hypothetical protein